MAQPTVADIELAKLLRTVADDLKEPLDPAIRDLADLSTAEVPEATPAPEAPEAAGIDTFHIGQAAAQGPAPESRPEPLVKVDLDRYSATVLDAEGYIIGRVTDLLLDDANEKPRFIGVMMNAGLPASLVPAAAIEDTPDGQIKIPFDRDTIQKAPRVGLNGRLSETDERALYKHFGLKYDLAPTRDIRPPGPGRSMF